MTSRVALISDTHGLVRPEIMRVIKDVDLVLHAGDVGGDDVIETLQVIAKTIAIRGNIDKDGKASKLPEEEVVEVEGKFIYMLHDLKEMNLDPAGAGFDVVVSGHSHQPKIETKEGVLYVNPGSVGPRRFSLPIAYALLEVTDTISVQIVEVPT